MCISSLNNPLVKRIRRLQRKARARQKEEAFFVEGVPITLRAIESQAPVEAILFCESFLTDDRAATTLAQRRATGVSCIAVSEDVFRGISQRNNPDGLAAICRTTWHDLDRLTAGSSSVFVAAVEVSDPGNLGTILRTMDSVGANGLILVGQCTNPFHPRTARASRGAVFTVPMCHCPEMETVFRWARAHHVHTVATSARAERSFRKVAYPLPILCIFGNEHRGLDDATIGTADQSVTIPMKGTGSSLNLSVAVGVVLYELARTRPECAGSSHGGT